MKNIFRILNLAVFALFIALFSIQCKKHTSKISEFPQGIHKYDFKELKQWFNANWYKPPRSQLNAASSTNTFIDEGTDIIPIDFVADRLRQVEPLWTKGRGFLYNGFVLYEIPVKTPGDILFKLMPEDPGVYIDTLSDISPSSVSALIIKEVGQERIGEIMTIVPAYEYLQIRGYDARNINLHINNIYQNQDIGFEFSGRILFHDHSGKLTREMTYMRGVLVYSNNYDPLDMLGVEPINFNSAAAPCETVTVVWRRCTQTIVDDEIVSQYCTPWIPIGVYQVGDCNNGQGGGAGTFNPAGFMADKGLSCKSFSFTKIASNWQECGVRGLQLVGDWFGPFMGFVIKRFPDVFVGVPVRKANGQVITSARAAEAAALAANRAGEVLAARYRGLLYEQFSAVPAAAIAAEFRLLMQGFLSDELGAGCTVSKSQSGSSPIRNAVWNSAWSSGGSCN